MFITNAVLKIYLKINFLNIFNDFFHGNFLDQKLGISCLSILISYELRIEIGNRQKNPC